MIKIANTLALLWLFALAIDPAYADFNDYQHFRRGLYELEFGTTYFNTTANYLGAGNVYQSLPGGQSMEDWNFYLSSRYDIDRRNAFYGKINVGDSISFGEDARRSNSGITDGSLGFAHLFFSDGVDVVGDFNVLVPMNSIDANADNVPNAEGVMQTSALIRFQKNFSLLLGYGYLGATYRSERSALLPWGFGLELHGSQLAFGAKLFGYQSITNDPDTNNQAQHATLQNRVSAGSEMFYAVNPSVVDSEVSLKFKMNPSWTLAGSAGLTVTGANTASGYHAAVALQYFWDSEPSYYLKSDDDGLSSSGKVHQFREETDDGVDQRLFQKNLTEPPPAGPPAEMTPAEPDVSVKRVTPRPPPAAATEVEPIGDVQIKLQRVKKKKKKKPVTQE